MQKVRRHSSKTAAPTACKRMVSGTISPPLRGTFHLSLTVLVHYRSPLVFSLAGWSPRIQSGFHVSGFTQVSERRAARVSPTGLSPSAAEIIHPGSATRAVCNSPGRSVVRPRPILQPRLRNAHRLPRNRFGLDPLSLATTQGIEAFFLFLRVLRCVISPGSLLAPYVFRCGYRGIAPLWVSPFGNPCFIARLRPHTAYRSLPRPSSASGAKASAIRS
jgi:hypothetical protein